MQNDKNETALETVTSLLKTFSVDVMNEIKKNNKKCNELDKTSAIFHGKTEAIEKIVCSHDEFIHGNGKDGAKTCISNLEKESNIRNKEFVEFKKQTNDEFKSLKGLVKTLIVALWGLVITIVAGLIALLAT